MRVQIVDPSAFTPPYDHALCAALARAGAEVELVTSRFAYGGVSRADGYAVSEHFYRRARGTPGSRLRRASKLLEHVPDMLALRRAARNADVVHFQWLAMQWLDGYLLPRRPVVLTAHDLLPREARPGQARAQRRLYDRVDAVITHSHYGRRQLVDRLGVPAAKVHVIHHGAFNHLVTPPEPAEVASEPAGLPPAGPRPEPAGLPPELAGLPPEPAGLPPEPAGLAPELAAVEGPVVLFFGLLRSYKGLETLLDAWRGVSGASLWIVGRPLMDLAPLRARADASVRFVPRYVSDAEMHALFTRADIVVLPYSRTERFDFSGVLATALAFGRPAVVTDVGGFSEVAQAGAARLVAPDDPAQLREALSDLIADPAARERLAAGALAAARGQYSWDAAARQTLALYQRLV